MALRRSIFGSQAEAEGFNAIQSTWGDHLLISPQVPWTALFDIGKLMHSRDSDEDRSELFRKTSVDYVVATRQGEPLLAIEFDGLLRGYSRRLEYVPRDLTHNPSRKHKHELKLKYAWEHGLPFFIVGSEEFRKWYSRKEEGIEFTFVDGVIGQVLSNRLIAHRFHLGAEDALRNTAELSADKRVEALEDWAIGLEVEAMVESNPIYRETLRIKSALIDAYQRSSYRERSKLTFTSESSRGLAPAGRDALLSAERVSCRCSISHSELGERSATVEVRNIGQPGTAEDISVQMAALLVWRKLWRTHRKTRVLR